MWRFTRPKSCTQALFVTKPGVTGRQTNHGDGQTPYRAVVRRPGFLTTDEPDVMRLANSDWDAPLELRDKMLIVAVGAAGAGFQ